MPQASICLYATDVSSVELRHLTKDCTIKRVVARNNMPNRQFNSDTLVAECGWLEIAEYDDHMDDTSAQIELTFEFGDLLLDKIQGAIDAFNHRGALDSWSIIEPPKKFAAFAQDLLADHKPEESDTYPGSWIAGVVVKRDYAQLGAILGEVHFLNEDGEATETPIGMLDSHNAFEEFFQLVIEKIFSLYAVLPQTGIVAPVDLTRLRTLVGLVENQDSEGAERLLSA